MKETCCVLAATAASLIYGASVEPWFGDGAAWRLLAAVTVGWVLSLGALLAMTQEGFARIAEHGSRIMVAGVLPLLPLTLANAVAPSAALNLAVLAFDGLLMLGLMIARLRAVWIAIVWFIVLETAGLSAWVAL